MTHAQRDEIPRGTLEMLILTTLIRGGPMHGFEIANSIQQESEDVLSVEEGSLYPALQRLLLKGWVTGEWARTADNRRARYYEVTRAGHRELAQQLTRYRRVSSAIARILQPA